MIGIVALIAIALIGAGVYAITGSQEVAEETKTSCNSCGGTCSSENSCNLEGCQMKSEGTCGCAKRQ